MVIGHNRHKNTGSSLVELVVGLIFFVIVALFFIDICTLVVSQTSNDRMSRNGARAAAEKYDSKLTADENTAAAKGAAESIIKGMPTTQIFTEPQLVADDFSYDKGGNGQVYVKTKVTCILPVPVPFFPDWSQVDLFSEDTETIVAKLAQ